MQQKNKTENKELYKNKYLMIKKIINALQYNTLCRAFCLVIDSLNSNGHWCVNFTLFMKFEQFQGVLVASWFFGKFFKGEKVEF